MAAKLQTIGYPMSLLNYIAGLQKSVQPLVQPIRASLTDDHQPFLQRSSTKFMLQPVPLAGSTQKIPPTFGQNLLPCYFNPLLLLVPSGGIENKSTQSSVTQSFRSLKTAFICLSHLFCKSNIPRSLTASHRAFQSFSSSWQLFF